jgi:hypothetical protein
MMQKHHEFVDSGQLESLIVSAYCLSRLWQRLSFERWCSFLKSFWLVSCSLRCLPDQHLIVFGDSSVPMLCSLFRQQEVGRARGWQHSVSLPVVNSLMSFGCRCTVDGLCLNFSRDHCLHSFWAKTVDLLDWWSVSPTPSLTKTFLWQGCILSVDGPSSFQTDSRWARSGPTLIQLAPLSVRSCL